MLKQSMFALLPTTFFQFTFTLMQYSSALISNKTPLLRHINGSQVVICYNHNSAPRLALRAGNNALDEPCNKSVLLYDKFRELAR